MVKVVVIEFQCPELDSEIITLQLLLLKVYLILEEILP